MKADDLISALERYIRHALDRCDNTREQIELLDELKAFIALAEREITGEEPDDD